MIFVCAWGQQCPVLLADLIRSKNLGSWNVDEASNGGIKCSGMPLQLDPHAAKKEDGLFRLESSKMPEENVRRLIGESRNPIPN